MSLFLGTHQNRLDAKGRVSVPAAFRAELKKLDAGTLVLRSSHTHACIEVWPEPTFASLEKPLLDLPDFSDEELARAATIFGDAGRFEPDKDGRIMLPDKMIRHASLSDAVVFIGLGRRFQIWEPVAGDAFLVAAREAERAREAARKLAAKAA